MSAYVQPIIHSYNSDCSKLPPSMDTNYPAIGCIGAVDSGTPSKDICESNKLYTNWYRHCCFWSGSNSNDGSCLPKMCCSNCKDVKEAYIEKGWKFDPTTIEICKEYIDKEPPGGFVSNNTDFIGYTGPFRVSLF